MFLFILTNAYEKIKFVKCQNRQSFYESFGYLFQGGEEE